MADLRFNVSAETRQATAALGSFAQSVQKNLVQAVRSLPNIEINADSSDAEREMKRIRDAMADLANKKVGVDIDAADAVAEVDRLQNELQALGGSTTDVSVRANVDTASKALDSIQTQVRGLDGTDAEVEVVADTAQAEQKLEGFGDAAKVSLAAAGAGAGAILASAFAQNLEMGEATAKFEAQLGNTGEGAKELGAIAGSLYANAYGESLGEVQQAVLQVVQSGALMEDATNEQIESITGRVMSLAQAFDQDLGATVSAVGQMIKTGMAGSAEEALDILARGFQQGNDKAGDLLDTFNEYGVQFQKLGVDGETAMGLLTQGLQAGARDADIVADAFKEFSIRAIDGSKLTGDSFNALGLNAKKMSDDIAAGGPRASAALDLTLDRLRGVKDPADRAAIAVGLFGTQAEDMGAALFELDVSNAVDGLGNVAGAAERLDATMGETAQAKVTAMQRGFDAWTQSLIATDGPLGDVAAGLAAFGPMALTAASAIAPLILALKMQGAAKAMHDVSGSMDKVGDSSDRNAKKMGEKGSGKGIVGKLGALATAAGGAYLALDSLSNVDVDIPLPDQGYWDGFGSQAQSNMKQVGDAFDSAMSGNFSKFSDQWSTYWSGGGQNIPLTVDAQAAWSTADAFINGINQTGATVQVDGDTVPLGDSVIRVMDAIAMGHATVTVDGQTMPAEEALNVLRERINAEQGQITINGTSVPAGDALFQVLSNINAASGTLVINGNQVPASESLATIQAAIDSGQGTVTINGNTYPAEEARALIESAINMTAPYVTINGQGQPAADALAYIEGVISRGGGIVTIDGQSMPADTALNVVKGRIDNTTGRMTLDGNNQPAVAAGTAAAQHANNQRPSMPVNADTGGAVGVIGRLRDWASTAVNFVVRAFGGNYHGGIYGPGPVPQYLAGGGVIDTVDPMTGRRMTPMATGVPAVAEPGHLRVFGDRPDVPESYIPWKPTSDRAHGLLEVTAAALGRVMLPRDAVAMAAGGMLGDSHAYYSSMAMAGGVVPVEQVRAGTVARSAVSAAVGTARGITASHGDAIVARLDALGSEVRGLRADSAKGNYGSAQLAALRSLAGALQQTRRDVPASADAQAGLSRSVTGAW